MSGFNSYQDSLNNNITDRTESDEELLEIIEENTPTVEEPSVAPIVTRDPTGEVQEQQPQNPMQAATEFVATKLGQDPKERDELRQQKIDGINDSIENAGGLGAVARDSVRAITSGTEKAFQDTIGFANFTGDFIKTKLGLVDPEDEWNNTDHANYIGSERDLVFAEPTSVAGQFARDMTSFVVLGNKLKGLAPGTPTSMAGRVGLNLTIGAVADFIMDPSDPNAAAALQQAFPSLQSSELLSVFATQDEDSEFVRRAKNSVEGSVLQLGVDAVGFGIRSLFRGAKPLLDWSSQNKGMRPSEAPNPDKIKAAEALLASLDKPTKEVLQELDELKAKVAADKKNVSYKQADFDLDSTGPGQKSLQLEAAGYVERPGKKARLEEARLNSGTKSSPDYEPYERAGKTAQYDINQVEQQIAYNDKSPRFTPGGPNPYLTDNTIRQINEAGGDIGIIKKAAAEIEADLLPKIKSNDSVLQQEALDRINRYRADNAEDAVDMSALTEMVDEAGLPTPYLRTLLGNNVSKILVSDTSNQIAELATASRQITEAGADANRQYNLLFDRLKALTKLQIQDASLRGSKLKALTGSLVNNTDAAVKKRIDNLHSNIEDLRRKVNKGDPDATNDIKLLADSLILADGDANMSQNFLEQFFKYGRENFETTMYNSYLSGLVTQERNLIGNAANVLLKPIQLAMGSMGNPKQARAALSAYIGLNDSIVEAFRVGKTAFATSGQKLRANTVEGAGGSLNMRQKIDNMHRRANNPGEHAAAVFLDAQYRMLANPMLQGATRMLDATDRAFKVISARQKLKIDMVNMAFEDGIVFDPKKYEINWGLKSKNGDILDDDLLAYAKQDTFQEDLGKNMSMTADMINTAPFMKYLIPFVKTPTNIIKQTAHYTPLLGRAVYNTPLGDVFLKEYSAIMRGNDETAKALYKGREGMGIMVGLTFTGMGLRGLSTGAGPRDPQKREIWELNNRPHSIKIGDTWVSNRFLGPIGILMSAYSDLGLIASNPGSYKDTADAFSQLVYATAGSLFEQSWMKGLFSVMDGINDVASGKDMGDPDEWQASLVRAMIPYQAALRSWSNTLVPGIKDYDSAWSKLAAETIPGVKAILGSERTSIRSGEPVANYGLSALNQFQPFSLAEIKDDFTVNQLIKYGIDVPLEFTDKYKGVKLEAKHQQRLNKLIATSGVWEDLERYFKSKTFIDRYNDWKQQNPPSDRATASWYTEPKRMLLDARNDAVVDYRNEVSADAIEFDRIVTAVENRDADNRRSNFRRASDAQSIINFAN